MSRHRMTDFEERDYYEYAPRRSEPELEERRRVVTRSPPSRFRESAPTFLHETARRPEAGPMVLRQREVETFDRHHRSPSPTRLREERLVRRPRSVSPPSRFYAEPEVDHRTRARVVHREHARNPSIERRRRSPSPRAIRYEREQPGERERIRARVVERRRSLSSSSASSSSASSAPKNIRGPTIEREVITHYTDVHHGAVKAKPPTPPPAPRPILRTRPREREREYNRETDIDISLSKDRTEVDVYRSSSRSRSKSRHHHGGGLIVRDSRSRRRAHSAAPVYSPVDEEGDKIAGRIDSRGHPGEAWHGATRKWEIIDVPPGTERVRMDGIGGGSTDTQWSKYSGVRRTKFIPERDEAPVRRESSRERLRDRFNHSSVDVDVDVRGRYRDVELDVDVDIDRRYSRRPSRAPAPPLPPAAPSREMWTEISKDLVVKEAIEELGYEYEDTPMFYYVMKYLRYEDVLQLVELSEDIRRYRKDRVREIQREHDWRDDWERRHRHDGHHHHHHHHPPPREHWDEERWREREVVYDSRRPAYR